MEPSNMYYVVSNLLLSLSCTNMATFCCKLAIRCSWASISLVCRSSSLARCALNRCTSTFRRDSLSSNFCIRCFSSAFSCPLCWIVRVRVCCSPSSAAIYDKKQHIFIKKKKSRATRCTLYPLK